MKADHTPEPIFLADNTRFKLCFNKAGNATNFHGWQNILDGRWVALVPAEDDSHMELYALRRQSLKLAVATRQRDDLLAALNAIIATPPQHGMNPKAKSSDPMEIKVGWNVHMIARAAIAKATGGGV